MTALFSGVIPYAIVALMALAGGGIAMHKLDAAKLATVEKNYAQAEASALTAAQAQQRVYDGIALAAAQKETADQAARATQAEAQLREVGNHVSVQTITSTCVPYGLVRLLDAAASGRVATGLSLPAGKSDGACAPVSWDALARSVVANYYTSRANAGQLNALIGAYRQMQAARK